jgi:hypothetical protein
MIASQRRGGVVGERALGHGRLGETSKAGDIASDVFS